MKRAIALLAACAAMLAPDARATHYKLFILTGQSNSLGTTNGGETDPSPGSDPTDQHVPFFWHNVVDASTSIGSSGGIFTTLQPQQGGVYAGSATHWGPEIEFARTLYRAGVRDFAVIKASRGGGGNSLWEKPSGHMYSHLVATVNTATTDLTNNGHTFEIAGLLYLQGESNNATEAAAAGNRLKTLTDNLRTDLTNAAAMHTVCAGITAQGNADDDTTRTNQAAVAASTGYIDYFENLDQQAKLAPDGLHLNKAAKTTVGNRFAQAFLNAGVVSRHYGRLVFIGDSITQGGNGDHPSYRYEVFKQLANAGVPQDAATGYAFTGSVTGPYHNSPLTTPDVNGQTFANVHDGHYGWRASWENGRVPLPAGRYNINNLGHGTLANWTGQATTYQTADAPTTKTYTGNTYTPDTVVIKIGINDLSDGTAATQVRDDIATLIDQLRAANPNVRIHLCKVLYTNSVPFSSVDALNALLPALVASKNATSPTSPVWLTDPNDGFNPSTMTYDNIHPNAVGEEHVGSRIAASLGIIEPLLATATPAAVVEKPSDTLGCFHYEGSDIYNSGSFASGWSTDGSLTATPTGDSDLRLAHPSTNGRTLNGTATGWSGICHTRWTFEARVKFNDISNGFVFWLGTGSRRIIVEAYADRTQDYGANSFSVSHNNHDGQFHTFKVVHDPASGIYHLWRDGTQLTPPAGANYDQTAADNRLLLGDYTGGAFGNHFDVTIDYVKYCTGFKGNHIHNGSGFINGWSKVQTNGTMTATIVNTDDLKIATTGNGGTWLEGTGTGWAANKQSNWTFELRAMFDNLPNGFEIWLGIGTAIVRVEIHADRTQDSGGQSFSANHNNTDGQYHSFRIAHDAAAGVYHVFRDGTRLTPLAGAAYDQTATEGRLILGDTTGGSFGNNFSATIDRINIDYTGTWIPVGTDTDADGMPDAWEYNHFLHPTNGAPDGDNDGDGKTNASEYHADTDPNNETSLLRINSIQQTTAGNFTITVPDTSPARQYSLYQSADLGITDAWSTVPGQTAITGTGGDLVFHAQPGSPHRFFRVTSSLP